MSSNRKWRVEGSRGDHDWFNWGTGESGTERCTRWGVIRPDDGSHLEFPTHAEALTYADRMARTITATLPRLAPEEWTTAGNFRVTPEPHGWGDALEVDELDDDGAYFIIDAEDCEPLALALLAHARRKDRN